MKRAAIGLLLAMAGGLLAWQYVGMGRADARSASLKEGDVGKIEKAGEAYGRLPLGFEENRGQAAAEVKYFARGHGYNLYLTGMDAVMVFQPIDGSGRAGEVLRMRIAGALAGSVVSGEGLLPGRINYILGRGRDLAGVPAFARVRYEGVLPGIDQVFYGNRREPEFDLVVAPGADAGAIELEFSGARSLKLDENGDLIAAVGDRRITLVRPSADQQGERVECSYRITGVSRVRIVPGAYDRTRQLVIDPILRYSTYLGGSVYDRINDIAIDSLGQAYVTGATVSGDFPVTTGAYQTSPGTGFADGACFVAKLDRFGSSLLYSTYIGRGNDTWGTSIAIDRFGSAYITGRTYDPGYPTTAGAFQTSVGRVPAAFVTKLNPLGTALVYSTLLGVASGSPGIGARGFSIAVDGAGTAYVTGDAGAGFPVTAGAFQTGFKGTAADAFVARVNATGSLLLYSTYLGGTDYDQGRAIVVDDAGSAYVTGTTGLISVPSYNSMPGMQMMPGPGIQGDFPVTAGAYQRILRGSSDYFVAKLNPAGSGLVYSTFLGGSGVEGAYFYSESQFGRSIAVDTTGNAFVTGMTYSADFPTTAGSFQTTKRGEDSDAFVTKLNATGSGLVYSTYLGGRSFDYANAIALDLFGNAYVTGFSLNDFPVTPDAFPGLPVGDSWTAFLAKLNRTGTSLSYSTYLGGTGNTFGVGLAVNAAGSAFVAGTTYAGDFPTTGGAFQNNRRGPSDGFVAKIVPGTPGMLVSRIVPNRGGDAGNVTTVIQGLGFQDGAAVKLARAGEADINATLVNISVDGRAISAVFNLAGKRLGLWNVVVTNPTGASEILASAFTIEAGREASIVIDQPWGWNQIRAGQKIWYYINYRNEGNNDVYGVPIWVKARGSQGSYNLRIASDVMAPAALSGEPPIDLSLVNKVFGTPDGALTTAVLVPYIAPGRSGYFAVELTGQPFVGTQMSLEAWANPPIFRQLDNPNLNFPDCYLNIVKLIGNRVGAPIPAACDDRIRQAWLEIITQAALKSYSAPNFSVNILSLPQVLTAIAAAGTRCAGFNVPLIDLINDMQIVLWADDQLNKCAGKISFVSLTITVITSRDPNAKFGPAGVDSARFIRGEDLLTYIVLFENVPTATAPAREVVITDQLDPNTMDLATFSLGPIYFGTNAEVPAPGATDFATDVDLRPEANLFVRVSATLDTATGLLTWRFTSIDPATGQPPANPAAGFLPPNVDSPKGSGGVIFSVRQKVGLASGTVIRNRARIVFDQNAPIETAIWANTVDRAAPSSQVLSLPATQSSNSFEVRWAGTDDTSGIANYRVFVSIDNGPFLPWLTTTSTAAVYTATSGSRLAFYSVATDRVGNAEDPPLVPDAVTTLASQPYDYSLRDDRTGDYLLVNSRTGVYQFTHCGTDGFTISGTGKIKFGLCSFTITNPLLNATFRICATNPFMSGQGWVKKTSAGPLYNLSDRDLSDNVSICR